MASTASASDSSTTAAAPAAAPAAAAGDSKAQLKIYFAASIRGKIHSKQGAAMQLTTTMPRQ